MTVYRFPERFATCSASIENLDPMGVHTGAVGNFSNGLGGDADALDLHVPVARRELPRQVREPGWWRPTTWRLG